jgi:predicted permease
MGFWQDISYGLRLFARNPGFTAIAVLSIALGTGANVAIFSFANALLLRPLPVERPSELVTVGSRITLGLATTIQASYPDYLDIRDRATSFDGLAAFDFAPVAIGLGEGAPTRVRMATIVSSNLFHVMGVDPVMGRTFLPEEERISDQNPVAVLSYGMWQSEFGGDPQVIGRHIAVAGVTCTVIGVTPASFTGMHPFVRDSIFLPFAMWPRLANFDTDPLTTRDFRNLAVKGRLKPGTSLAAAAAELLTIGKALERAYPDTNKNQVPVPETEFTVNWERRPLDVGLIAILTTLSVSVLCVACANVAGMLTSWAPVRAREIALRLAIGAGRGRLIRQLLSESVAIAVAGSVGGVAVGYVGILLLRQIQLPSDVISLPTLELDKHDLVFSLFVAGVSAIVVGLGPALQTTRVDLASAIRTVGAPNVARRAPRSRSVLVGLQVALALVLVTIAAFAHQMFSEQLRKGPGFRVSHMVKITVNPGQAGYDNEESRQLFARLIDEVQRLAGIRNVTLLSAMPLFSFNVLPIAPAGHQFPEGQTGIFTYENDVDERYFDTMDIPILAGRAFTSSDTPESTKVAIVNQRFAEQYWPGQNAIGRRFQIMGTQARWLEIVGVAKTTLYGYPAEEPRAAFYLPFRQRRGRSMVLVAQTVDDSATTLPVVAAVIKQTAPDVPTYDAQTIEAFYDARVGRLGVVLVGLVGGMGIMGVGLTMVGLYGLVSYAVSQRTREIGIRMAIGATPSSIVQMILRDGLRPVWWGLALGVVLSIVAANELPALVHILSVVDPRLFPVAAVALFGVVVIAAAVPASRAARVNPTTALRCD